MEMKKPWTEILNTNNVVDDENHNCFDIEIHKDIQVLPSSEYQLTLEVVPSVSYDEASNVVAMQQVSQGTEVNYRINIKYKNKTNSGAVVDEEVVTSEWSQSSDDEPLASLMKKNVERNCYEMIWKDPRFMFGCDKCPYGAKKRYLLLRHLKTHYKDRLNTSEKGSSTLIDNTGKISDKNDTAVGHDAPTTDVEHDAHSITKKSYLENNEINDEDGLSCTFTCTECPYNTNKKYLLARHFRTHSGERPHKCKVCDRGFTTGTSLLAHTNMHYGVKQYSCKHCEKSFTTSGELNRHVKYKHTQEKPHKCTECDYAAVESSKLKRHMRYHTGERPYQCQHCTYASQDMYHLTRHLRKHTGEKPYKCDSCNASYAHSTSLKLHKLVHDPSEKQVHVCELCPATNIRKSDLRRHIQRMHFSDKLLRCKRCGATFSDQYLYKLHNKTHEHEKCFKCQLCSFASKKFVHLKRHMIIHTELNAIDNTQYLISNNLLVHQQIQYKKQSNVTKEKCHQCQKCQRSFAYKGCLTRHEAIHVKTQGTSQE